MKYSNDELICIIQETAKRLDRSPKISDISQSHTIINRFGSWNEALKKAGLNINKERSYRTYSDIELINIVVRWIKENNKIPNRKEWCNVSDVPSPELYRVRFKKTWAEFIEMIGYGEASKNHYRFKNANISNEEILDMFKVEINYILKITSGAITSKLYDKHKNPDFLSSSGMMDRFNKKWSDLLLLSNCPKSRINKYKFSREELITIIGDLAIKLNKTPSLLDLSKEGITDQQIYAIFTSYEEALKEADVNIVFSKVDEVKETKEELLQMYINFCEKIGKVASAKDLDRSDDIYNANVFSIRFNGLNNLRKQANLPTCVRKQPKYSKNELNKILISLYKEKGRRLKNKELLEYKLYTTTIMRYFETTSMNYVWGQIEKNMFDTTKT
ncbi:homing endonuclease associated repeat-containing protein [Bacillus sp. FSL R12-0069]|uniref:homing endonuclease associated repeat-containing protein n=1 Tax=Bacillus sp. FSL R12-0069 TaxID=2975342 RepID=UPI0030FA4F8B